MSGNLPAVLHRQQPSEGVQTAQVRANRPLGFTVKYTLSPGLASIHTLNLPSLTSCLTQSGSATLLLMRCLIGDFLPINEVSLLAGPAHAGKTTLLLQLCADLQANHSPFGYKVHKPLALAYLAADRSWAAYEHSANLIGLDLSKLPSRAIVNDPMVDAAEFEINPLNLLFHLLEDFRGADLIIVDPLIAFLGVNLNAYHLVVAKLLRLNRWCCEHSTTILGTHHANKFRSDSQFPRPQDRLSGSSGIQGFTSSQLTLLPPAETGHPYTEWHIISHHAAPICHWLTRDDHGLFHLLDRDQQTAYESLGPSALAVLQLLGALPMTRAEIVEACPHSSPRAVDAGLSRLTAAGLIHKVRQGVYAKSSQLAVID